MADTLTPEQRRRCMSSVKGGNTGPEVKLRKALWNRGLRYRLRYKLPGKPDLVFVSARVVVFVDGCFWHGCPEHGSMPATNREFWERKILGNLERDKRVTNELSGLGWEVLRFWEHQTKSDLDSTVEIVVRTVQKKLKV